MMNNVGVVFDKHVYRLILGLAFATLGTGTLVYHFSMKISWVDAYYFSVVTLTTVGYGDIVPKTNFQKIFTTFYILVGVAIITTFITATARRSGAKYQQRNSEKESKK